MQNNHHHTYKDAKTVVAEDMQDIIDHMIHMSYHQLSLKLYQHLSNIHCIHYLHMYTGTKGVHVHWLNLVIMDTVCSCTEKVIALRRIWNHDAPREIIAINMVNTRRFATKYRGCMYVFMYIYLDQTQRIQCKRSYTSGYKFITLSWPRPLSVNRKIVTGQKMYVKLK